MSAPLAEIATADFATVNGILVQRGAAIRRVLELTDQITELQAQRAGEQTDVDDLEADAIAAMTTALAESFTGIPFVVTISDDNKIVVTLT